MLLAVCTPDGGGEMLTECFIVIIYKQCAQNMFSPERWRILFHLKKKKKTQLPTDKLRNNLMCSMCWLLGCVGKVAVGDLDGCELKGT